MFGTNVVTRRVPRGTRDPLAFASHVGLRDRSARLPRGLRDRSARSCPARPTWDYALARLASHVGPTDTFGSRPTWDDATFDSKLSGASHVGRHDTFDSRPTWD